MEARFLFIIGEGEERAVYTHFCRKLRDKKHQLKNWRTPRLILHTALSKDSYTIGTLRWRQRYWR
jgi:hypothetical protein